MHDECVPPATRELAERLAPIADRHELALGGGTACALHLAHRTSADLDFFSLRPLEPHDLLSDLDDLREARLRGVSASEIALVLSGIDISATSLGREALDEISTWRGVRVLGPLDLAELKVDAAVRRGMARDLCDLHLLCTRGSADLAAAIRASGIDSVVALKALTDRECFAGQPSPDLRVPWSADQAVEFFAAEARRIIGSPGWS